MEISITHAPPSGWDEFVQSHEAGSFVQTTDYAAYRAFDLKQKPVYFAAHEHGKLAGALLAFEGSSLDAWLFARPVFALTRHAAKVIRAQLDWTNGPVAHPNSNAYAQLVRAAVEYAKKKKLRVAAAPHPLFFDAKAYENAANSSLIRREAATFVVDLREGEEKAFSRVDHAARKLVRRTLDTPGFAIRAVRNETDLRAYFAALNESRARSKAPALRYSATMWKMFRAHDQGELYLAEQKSEDGKRVDVLSVLGVTWTAGWLQEWGAGGTKLALDSKIYAGDALKWHAVQQGIAHHARYYDLSGVAPNPKEGSKEHGIYRYKAKWGGNLVSYPVYSQKA